MTGDETTRRCLRKLLNYHNRAALGAAGVDVCIIAYINELRQTLALSCFDSSFARAWFGPLQHFAFCLSLILHLFVSNGQEKEEKRRRDCDILLLLRQNLF